MKGVLLGHGSMTAVVQVCSQRPGAHETYEVIARATFDCHCLSKRAERILNVIVSYL